MMQNMSHHQHLLFEFGVQTSGETMIPILDAFFNEDAIDIITSPINPLQEEK
jgi:hypothetical protein